MAFGDTVNVNKMRGMKPQYVVTSGPSVGMHATMMAMPHQRRTTDSFTFDCRLFMVEELFPGKGEGKETCKVISLFCRKEKSAEE